MATPLGAPDSGVDRRLPALDGLRGLAIVLVLVQNLYTHVASTHPSDLLVSRIAWSGWIGVDLFFALSGFLITSILWETKASPTFFRDFYIRRALRILPLYYGVLVFLFLILPHLHLLSASALQPLVERQGWYWFHLTNVMVSIRGWESAPLNTGHFWSLAVEEQFYLVWPLVIAWLDSRRVAWLCVGLIGGALAFRIWGGAVGLTHAALYSLPISRMDALAAGSLVATLARGPGGRARLLAGRAWLAIVAGAAVLLLAAWRKGLDSSDPVVQTIGFSVLAAGAAALVSYAAFNAPDTRLGRALAHRGLQFMGKYSYAIYVFHPLVLLALLTLFPIHRMIESAPGPHWPWALALVVVAAVVSTAVALLSWHGWEKHFLKLKRRFPRRGPVSAVDLRSVPLESMENRQEI